MSRTKLTNAFSIQLVKIFVEGDKTSWDISVVVKVD